MNALAMPISSRTAEDMSSACFCTKSPRILEARAATAWLTLASSALSFLSAGCISHDAIIPEGALRAAGVVQVVQMGYRFAHGEERLVRVERPAEQHGQQFRRAFRAFQGFGQLGQPVAMMLLQLPDSLVRAPERLAVRRQHQHVVGRSEEHTSELQSLA